MMLVRRNPRYLTTRNFDSFDNLMNNFMTGVFDSEAVWSPKVDIVEREKDYLFLVELPGLEKSEVKLTVENGMLTLKGERKELETGKGDEFSRRERFYGKFERTFNLPDDINVDKITAKMKNGVLELAITKKPEALPKEIEIKLS